jgi:hypothetical protein
VIIQVQLGYEISQGRDITKTLFVPASQLTFSVEKLRSQKQKQIVNFLTVFWNAEKQAYEEMN